MENMLILKIESGQPFPNEILLQLRRVKARWGLAVICTRALSHIAMIGVLLFSSTAAYAAHSVIITQPHYNEENYHSFCDFQYDEMRLVIRDGAKTLTQYDFCSSYGEAEAELVTDRLGKEYMLLRYGEGRGTNATTRYLSVFPVGHDLIEYIRTPIFAGAGLHAQWRYSYKVSTPKEGGIRLTLHLKIDKNGEDPEDELYAPAEKYRTIDIGFPVH